MSARNGSAVGPNREELLGALRDLSNQIDARDTELSVLFDRFVDDFQRLHGEVAAANRTIGGLQTRIAELADRLDTVVSASLLGPIRRDA